MENKLEPFLGTQTFKEIITSKAIYVDKTAYLANMIEKNVKTWFLVRPRRFGKSLTVSTLESLFLGEKDLFQGLSIEKKLSEKKFATRPVIHLDLSGIITEKGPDEFEKALGRRTAEVAEWLDIDVPEDIPANEILGKLIGRLFRKHGRQVAVLIDEYDSPVTNLADHPDEAEKIRIPLRRYYSELKRLDRYISFIFVTGITKYVQGGLYSAFNSPTDISVNPMFGAMVGFTHEEVKYYYGRQISEVAQSQNVSSKILLEKMKNYYNGFSFDAQTFVYNPFSTLLFFLKKNSAISGLVQVLPSQ
jgi:hypothetical protein